MSLRVLRLAQDKLREAILVGSRAQRLPLVEVDA
jgi:hypothetical protein